MYVPRANAHPAEFAAAIERAAGQLAPNVVGIIPALGNDWVGEPAVFLTVILSDAAASRPDQLLNITDHVSNFIDQNVAPLEEWGVLPYFTYRTRAEQATLEPTWA